MMTPVINALTPSTEWVDTIAMLGFSFAGILAARGRGVDPVGVFILAFTSAFGGVTVRDMLLDIRPFYWVSHEAFTWLIICFTIFAPVIAARLSDRIAQTLWAGRIYRLLVWNRAPFGRRCRSNRHFGDRRFNRADPYVHTEGELGNSLSLSALTPHIPWERAYQSDAHPSAF